MKELDKGYSADFDHTGKHEWYEIMSRFRDANLYQSWSYDMVRHNRQSVAHMILRKKDRLVAAAKVRVVRLHGTKVGIAYVMWGPMWRLAGGTDDMEVFRQAVRALRNELSCRGGLLLRLYPLAFQNEDNETEQILYEEGYKFFDDGRNKQTLIMDLDKPLEELRASLHQKWRNCLNRAEKNGLELISGEEDGLFEEVTKIYWEMVRRKGLDDISDINHLRNVQGDLPPSYKLKALLCRQKGELAAGAIFSAIGTTGVYLVGATSDTGLKTKGSYLIQWTFVKWLKQNGFLHYDLNGINPRTNPGTYRFKCGLAGKQGRDIEFLGKFQVADSKISSLVVKGGEFVLSRYQRLTKALRDIRWIKYRN